MNLKTTLVLLILVVAGGVLWWLDVLRPTASTAGRSSTLEVLTKELTPEKLTLIEVRQGERQLTLSRGEGGDWGLPGRWPARKAEADKLVELLTHLHSRFAPIKLDEEEPDLESYGLDKPPVVVTVKAAGKKYQLAFGEEPGGDNRFSRPTYLRLDEEMEVIRLAPGLIAALDRPLDYYQQRRLFPSERVVKEGGFGETQEKVDRLSARTIEVKGKEDGGGYKLERPGDSADWELKQPVRDRPDPDKLRTLLAAVPDIWAEQFIPAKEKKSLEEYGLQDPEQTIEVTTKNGDTITLLIGKRSQTKVRTVLKPSPPFGPPMPPQREMVHEEYRYARLKDNPQVFEIKADKLKDVFVPLGDLRDPRLARFRSEDARRLEITRGKEEIVLAKEKDRWKLEKPIAADAESSKVTELLDRLSNLQARDKDVIDAKDATAYGLDQPSAVVKVTVEEEVTGEKDAKTKKTKTFTFQLGKEDKEPGKLFVRLEGLDRVNRVDDEVRKLAERPGLAYRGRRMLDFTGNNLAQFEVQRGDEKFVLKQDRGVWKLTAPVAADADTVTAADLAGDLGRLEAVEFVAEDPKDLETYGLAKPTLSAVLTFTDEKKPAETLLIGKQRDKKTDYFAKLASAPGVFVVKKEIKDDLDRGSLAYRPRQLWQFPDDDLSAVKIQRQNEPEYELKRDGSDWKIAGPFAASADPAVAQRRLTDLTPLRCERYETHAAKELDKFGLDKPFLKLTVVTADKQDPKPDKDKKDEKEKKEPEKPKPQERVLLIGQPTAKDADTRFAKLGDSDAIFVVADKLVAAVDHAALDWLDRKLLRLNEQAITKVTSSAKPALTIERKDNAWQVEAGKNKFTADDEAMRKALKTWSNLRGEKFAAYGPKLDLAMYGLHKPAVTVTITATGNDDKPVEHVVVLGKPVEGSDGERYARLTNQQGVVVLSAADAAELGRTYLDFVERTLLKLDPAAVTSIQRKTGSQELELVKKDDWQLVKPEMHKADNPTLERLVEELARLRAKRVAAYPVKDTKAFGLEEPAAVVTLRLGEADGKPMTSVLKIGKPADEDGKETGDRYVQVEGSQVVGVLPEELAARLLAEPIKFRDKALARFADADKIVLVRGSRKATFAKVDGTWKLVEPVEAEAEQADLEEFVNLLARLRADELVADKSKPNKDDLKPYGLDRPEARWRLLSGDLEVLNLLVGGREKIKDRDGPRSYAKLATSDVIFLLDPRLTARVLGEYRGRTLWAPPLDAAQIETIEFGWETQPFTLQKVDNTWQVVGKPEFKLNPSAVSDTLAALANLKAERTVVDKDPDLKLYGLDPAKLILTIRTPTGKRVLHVGANEGESQRRYANVPDGKRGDVFVISEADAARIVRQLMAFKAEEGKAASD